MSRGYVDIEFNGKKKRIYGGSFFHAPEGDDYSKINLMAEAPDLPCHYYLPINDFSTPTSSSEVIDVFEKILKDDKDVYVGCFGGIGRTGLFIGSLLKYIGHPQPIHLTRDSYYFKAIETMEQENFVACFPTREKIFDFKKKDIADK